MVYVAIIQFSEILQKKTSQQTQNIFYNICTTSAERLRCWAGIVHML